MPDGQALEHEEFKSLYRAGSLDVRANMDVAMHICDNDPRIPFPAKAAHHFWKWAGLLMLIGGLGSFFFISWHWSALIFFGSFPVVVATRQSAGQFVIQAAVEDKSLYEDCLSAGAIMITRN